MVRGCWGGGDRGTVDEDVDGSEPWSHQYVRTSRADRQQECRLRTCSSAAVAEDGGTQKSDFRFIERRLRNLPIALKPHAGPSTVR